MMLQTTDAFALLGYAGLGETEVGKTEPADWMCKVLRGRNFPLEQSLIAVAAALQTQFPPHLRQMPGSSEAAHSIFVSAFVGDEPRLYEIDIVSSPDREKFYFRHTRHVVNRGPLTGLPPPIAMAGSGASYLWCNKPLARALLRLVREHDRGLLSAHGVADNFARINFHVHKSVSSVGPRCVVAWRFRKPRNGWEGGGHQFYTQKTRDAGLDPLPTISVGRDLGDICDAIQPLSIKQVEAFRKDGVLRQLDKDEANAALARLATKPDEKLR
jgi:hypothetical protein